MDSVAFLTLASVCKPVLPLSSVHRLTPVYVVPDTVTVVAGSACSAARSKAMGLVTAPETANALDTPPPLPVAVEPDGRTSSRARLET